MKIENYEKATPLIDELNNLKEKIRNLEAAKDFTTLVTFRHVMNNNWRDDYDSYDGDFNEYIRMTILNHLTEKANILKSKIEEL